MEPNDKFPFDKLVLTTPTFVNSGNYFIKFLMNDSPLYIQPPKCVTKQGIIKAGKKMFCDMLFTNENESFIQWMENLEVYSQKYIFENRSKWFENNLEMHDIENSFVSTMKIYKSGKFYIIRTIIPTRLGTCTLKVFNEDEMMIDIDEIKDMTNVMTIWEILGIKCSSRSFQIDIEVKQMMVVKPEKLFETCIFTRSTVDNDPKTPKNERLVDLAQSTSPEEHLEQSTTEHSVKYNDVAEVQSTETFNQISPNMDAQPSNPTTIFNEGEVKVDVLDTTDDVADPESKDNEASLINSEMALEEKNDTVISEEEEDEGDIEILESQGASNDLEHSDLEMVDLNLDIIKDDSDIQLKNRNDVYYEVYMEAKQKAEEARNLAISAYLEAKRIKELYMIQEPLDIFTSDSSAF